MDSDQGKLFVGGISWETTEEKLKDYFGQYGDVFQANIMRDKVSGRPRGFGFVLFSDPSVVDRVLQDKHTIDGRPVEAKRAMSREEQQNSARSGNTNGGSNVGTGGNFRTKKIFVGGLPPTLSDEGFRQYFENFGHVTDVVIMYDQNTQRPRGFGFISFDSEDAVDRVLQKTFHDLNGKQVEVKRALPKDANPGMANRRSGGGGSGNYGYGSGGNQNSYDSRMDSNRYVQPQNAGGAFPPYGSSGYAATGYGYGPANNGMGYGGYAGHGAAAGAAYGNSNVAGAGYVNGPAGVPRNSWNGQTASGYGAAGYGSAGAWGAAAGGGPAGQSPNAAFAYGSQGYGYGNYGGGDGSYGRIASGGSGAGGDNSGGYGDANGHGGYGAGNYGVPGTGPHNAAMGYGGGYVGGQNRQSQQ